MPLNKETKPNLFDNFSKKLLENKVIVAAILVVDLFLDCCVVWNDTRFKQFSNVFFIMFINILESLKLKLWLVSKLRLTKPLFIFSLFKFLL